MDLTKKKKMAKPHLWQAIQIPSVVLSAILPTTHQPRKNHIAFVQTIKIPLTEMLLNKRIKQPRLDNQKVCPWKNRIETHLNKVLKKLLIKQKLT